MVNAISTDYFTGSGGVISLPYTILAFIVPNSIFWNALGTNGFTIYRSGDGAISLSFDIGNGGSGPRIITESAILYNLSPSELGNQNYIQVGVTCDSEGIEIIYVNGQPTDASGENPSSPPFSPDFIIAQPFVSTGFRQAFTAIYDVALTGPQIEYLYNSGQGRIPIPEFEPGGAIYIMPSMELNLVMNPIN